MYNLTNASIYSMKGEIVYHLTYTQGYEVRSIVSSNKMIRVECKLNDSNVWIQQRKAYIIKNNNNRSAERIVNTAKQFITSN